MGTEISLTVGQRLAQFLDELGLPHAHFCLRSIADLADLLRVAPERIASATVCGVTGNPRELRPVLDRTLWIEGDAGEGAGRVLQSLSAMGANVLRLPGYLDVPWSDTAAERTVEVAEGMLGFLEEMDGRAGPAPVSISREGEIAGIRYRAAGSGTPVVLLPMNLSARQWDPVLPALQARHCTVVLGGRYLMPVSNLEARAETDYGRMALDLLATVEPRPGESLIESGCGPGALLRRMARRWPPLRLSGLDVNAFLLGEAHALAAAEGLAGRIVLHEGSAEAIPLPDGGYDIGFSSTMMEEGDARKMLAELVRVTKPGGRVAVIVRAIDMPRWTNLPLPESLRRRATRPTGGVTADGCADASLLERMHEAGLKDVQGGPAWAWVHPGSRYWDTMIATMLGGLTADEAGSWNEALAQALAAGRPVCYAQPYHCAAGLK